MTPLEELSRLLRPAGGGIHLVSTGRSEQLALSRRLYGATSESAVQAAFEAQLERVAGARGVILAIPSDVGAGFRRGANLGPQAIRTALLDGEPDFPGWLRAQGVVDLGDVFVVPQLLHDDMLAPAQIAATRRAIYGDPDCALPVSPLSIAERALDLVLSINPGIKPFVIGGDHACAWPVIAALAKVRPPERDRWCIVQPDAHTDLLEERLGVRYCFATWSFHANSRLGRGGRLVQVGIRASRFPREHWESTLDVRQFWADECLRDPTGAIDAILSHLEKIGASSVYFSNDIDGTDALYADATGTPEPHGLQPEMVIDLIRRLGAQIGLCGGDIMEVAPPLGESADSRKRTVDLAARYFRETLTAGLREPSRRL